jgi:hypothetical protein
MTSRKDSALTDGEASEHAYSNTVESFPEVALVPMLAALPVPAAPRSAQEPRRQWEQGPAGRTPRITLPSALPRLRLLLGMDNRTGHRPPSLVLWLCAQGLRPLDTPLGGLGCIGGSPSSGS